MLKGDYMMSDVKQMQIYVKDFCFAKIFAHLTGKKVNWNM